MNYAVSKLIIDRRIETGRSETFSSSGGEGGMLRGTQILMRAPLLNLSPHTESELQLNLKAALICLYLLLLEAY